LTFVTAKSLDCVSPVLNLFLEELEDSSACTGKLVEQKVDIGISAEVIDKDDEVGCTYNRFGRKQSTGNGMYKFKWSCGMLYQYLNDLPFMLG